MGTPIPTGEGVPEGNKKEPVKPETALQGLKQQIEKPVEGELQQLKQTVDASIDSPEKKIAALKEWFKLNYKADVRLLAKEEKCDSNTAAYPVTDIARTAIELEKLKEQLIKIPSDFFIKLGVKEFVMAGKITTVINKEGKKMNLFAAASPQSPSVYMARAWPLHHEFFHIMDGKFAGGLRGGMEITPFNENWYMQNKEEWEALDPVDKGKWDLDEDQAEYCSTLFNLDHPKIREEYEKLLSDPGKMKKIEQMKKWLLEWSDGKFTDQYWKDLQEGKVVEGYWKKR